MDYLRLSPEYLGHQIERIEKLRKKIVTRHEAPPEGRVVPEEDDLVIGTGRRLPMAVLFLDLCSFSSRPSESTAEQDLLLRVLNLFFTEMIRVCEDYGGTVEKNTGDGLMVYFEDGGGQPPQGGCTRAVAAAATMLFTTSAVLNPIMKASGLPDLEFRVGVDYGTVTVARLAAAGRFGALVAIGATANLASKLLDHGGPGMILLGENVVSQLPVAWRRWCILHKALTGWTFLESGLPYSFYRFDGRWQSPV